MGGKFTTMEAPEVPTEQLHEQIHEHVHLSKEKWLSLVAVATAVIAALAAFASMLAGKYETEAMLESMNKNDQYAYYQAKSIKSAILAFQIESIQSLKQPVNPEYIEKRESYKREMQSIQADAKKFEEESKIHLDRHELLAGAVTMFQIAVAMSAICVLMKRKSLFAVALAFMMVGIGLLIYQAFPHAAAAEAQEVQKEAVGK